MSRVWTVVAGVPLCVLSFTYLNWDAVFTSVLYLCHPLLERVRMSGRVTAFRYSAWSTYVLAGLAFLLPSVWARSLLPTCPPSIASPTTHILYAVLIWRLRTSALLVSNFDLALASISVHVLAVYDPPGCNLLALHCTAHLIANVPVLIATTLHRHPAQPSSTPHFALVMIVLKVLVVAVGVALASVAARSLTPPHLLYLSLTVFLGIRSVALPSSRRYIMRQVDQVRRWWRRPERLIGACRDGTLEDLILELDRLHLIRPDDWSVVLDRMDVRDAKPLKVAFGREDERWAVELVRRAYPVNVVTLRDMDRALAEHRMRFVHWVMRRNEFLRGEKWSVVDARYCSEGFLRLVHHIMLTLKASPYSVHLPNELQIVIIENLIDSDRIPVDQFHDHLVSRHITFPPT